MRYAVFGWKNWNRKGYFKAKLIFLCALASLTLAYIFWQNSRKTAHAAGQTAPAEQKSAIKNSLLKPILRIEGRATDAAETQELESIFSSSDAAIAAGYANATNKELFKRQVIAAELDELEDFTRNHPNSAWTPSLRVRLGQYYHDKKRYNAAYDHLSAAWNALPGMNSGNAKQTADTAIAYLTRVLVFIGKTEMLSDIYKDLGDYIPDGSLADFWLRTREKHARVIKMDFDSYKCGIFAIDRIASRVLGTANYSQSALLRIRATTNGFSLFQLQEIAAGIGLNLSPVQRVQGADIVVPSVLHWGYDHYSAIVAEQNELYLVVDPSSGPPVWLTADEINAEASGYFLVPATEVKAPFVSIDSVAAGRVIGKVSSCPPEDWNDDSCEGGEGSPQNGPNSPSASLQAQGAGAMGKSWAGVSDADVLAARGGCKSCGGMPVWSVSEPYLNLWVQDIPMSYQPSKGPPVTLKLNYRQRGLAPTDGINPVGYNWGLTWRSFVDPNTDVQFGTGARRSYVFTSGDISDLQYDSNTRLEKLRSGGTLIGYAVLYGDGSKDKFTYSYWDFWYLTEKIAPDGNKLTFAYTDANLTSIQDADGNYTYIYYADIDYPDLITSVTAPGSRTVSFSYTNMRLTGIEDVEGISSSFAYDPYGMIMTGLTTPYGTTLFDTSGAYNSWGRAMTIGHPDGTREAYLYLDYYDADTDMPNDFDGSQLPQNTPFSNGTYPYGTIETSSRRDRNTFYWNRQQFATLSSTNFADFRWPDLKKARIRHWLWKSDDASYNHADTLSHEQSPSQDGSTEGLITFFDYTGKNYTAPEIRGDQVLPAVEARRQPDGTTWWVHNYYNSLGKLTGKVEKWTDSGFDYNRSWTNIFAANGIDLIESRGPDGVRESGYAYDDVNHPHLPIKMTNALGEITLYSYYSGSHKLNTVQTPSGLLSTYNYNSGNGYTQSIVDSVSGTPLRTNGYSWSNGQLSTHTNALGLILTYTHDKLDRLKRIDYPDSSFTENWYTNGAGAKILDAGKTVDRLGNPTYFAYNAFRQVTDIQDSLGRITHHDYCSCGSPEYIRKAYGTGLQENTQYVFDYQGHATQIIHPGSITITNAYDSLGQLVIIRDALGATTNSYDNLGRLSTVANARGSEKILVYDNEDRITAMADQNGVIYSRTYDNLGRLRTREVLGAGTEAFGYSANVSGPTSYTNQLNKVVQYEYHPAGWKTKEIYVGVSTNTFAYDPAGNMRTLTDGKSQLTSWGYDQYSRVKSKTNDNNLEILRYTYDANSRLTNRWSKTKLDTKYAYDAVGSLTNVDYNSSTDIRYKYDALNRLTNMVDAVGTTSWYIDTANRLTVEDGPWPSDNVTNRWNTAGFRTNLAILQPASYFNNNYAYDSARRLSSITSGAGTFNYYYHPGLNSFLTPAKLITGISLPNTSSITNFWDDQARWTETDLKNSSSIILNKHAYVYNNANQRTKQTFTDGGYVNYLYDDVGELYSARTYDVGNAEIMAERFGYTFDPAWNITKKTNNVTTTTYTLNNLNQVTSGYSYDDNGNRTISNSYYNYTYDDENQLTSESFNYTTPGWKVEFTYDGKMRLRTRSDYSWTGAAWNFTGSTKYIYDGMLVVQERDYGNNPTVTYTSGTDLSGTLEGAGGIGGLLARSSGYSGGSWSTHNFYHADGNGNITYLVNSSQTLAASYKYNPFGGTISSSGSLASGNTYRFSSKEYHTNPGLYYYGYRFYDPNLQRWLNRDPKRELGFEMMRQRWLPYNPIWVRLYSYVLNRPTTVIDPLGLGEGTLGMQGNCCNQGSKREWALVSGNWVYLDPGECTANGYGIDDEDCDGMTCNGGFYYVGDTGSADCKPGPKPGTCNLNPKKKWTPTKQGPKAQPPVWDDKIKKGRGSRRGNTPPGYIYVP